MADGELTKLAKAAGTSFGLFKAQLAREGHKIRGDVDYREMSGISAAAVSLRAQYLRDQDSLDAYAEGGGYQSSLALDDEDGEPARPPKKQAPPPRGIGTETIQTATGQRYRATTLARADGIALKIERIDDMGELIQNVFEQDYLGSEEAWAGWDDYAAGLAVLFEHTNGKQEIGGTPYVVNVSSETPEGGAERWYFELVSGGTTLTNGARDTEADAWAALDAWARNTFEAKVIASDEPAAKPKGKRAKK